MEYLVIAFACKFAVEVAFFVAKACVKRYKASEKPGVTAPDKY